MFRKVSETKKFVYNNWVNDGDYDDDDKFAPIQVQFRTAQVTGMWIGLDSGHGDNDDGDENGDGDDNDYDEDDDGGHGDNYDENDDFDDH